MTTSSSRLRRGVYWTSVYVVLIAGVALPLLAFSALWWGLSPVVLFPLTVAFVLTLIAFKKIAPPPRDPSNRSNPVVRRVIFAGVIVLALAFAVFAALHPPLVRR